MNYKYLAHVPKKTPCSSARDAILLINSLYLMIHRVTNKRRHAITLLSLG